MKRLFFFIVFSLVTLSGFAIPKDTLPKQVYAFFKIIRVNDLNYINQSYELDFYFKMWWAVDTLKLKQRLNLEEKTLKEGDIINKRLLDWSPYHDFINAHPIVYYKPPIHTYTRGFIHFDARLIGTFYTDMDLQKFPFDNQNLDIILEDFILTDERLQLIYGAPFTATEVQKDTITIPNDQAFADHSGFIEFTLNDTTKVVKSVHTYDFSGEKQDFSQLKFTANISRETGYYISKVIIISLIIVLMSMSAFFINPKDLAERSGISITAFLALVGHNFVINSFLPKIPYLTIMDYITLGTSLLVFLTFMINIIAYLKHKWSLQTKVGKLTIDRIALALFSLLLTLLFLITYLNVS